MRLQELSSDVVEVAEFRSFTIVPPSSSSGVLKRKSEFGDSHSHASQQTIAIPFSLAGHPHLLRRAAASGRHHLRALTSLLEVRRVPVQTCRDRGSDG